METGAQRLFYDAGHGDFFLNGMTEIEPSKGIKRELFRIKPEIQLVLGLGGGEAAWQHLLSLIESKPDVNIYNEKLKSGGTVGGGPHPPLIVAADLGNAKRVSMLLEASADVNVIWTSVESRLAGGMGSMAGSRLSVKIDSYTALACAVRRHYGAVVPVVQTLIAAGADVHCTATSPQIVAIMTDTTCSRISVSRRRVGKRRCGFARVRCSWSEHLQQDPEHPHR